MEQVVPVARGCHQLVPQTLSKCAMALNAVNSGSIDASRSSSDTASSSSRLMPVPVMRLDSPPLSPPVNVGMTGISGLTAYSGLCNRYREDDAPSSLQSAPPIKRPRTTEDFYQFCTFVLEYTGYQGQDSQSSPLKTSLRQIAGDSSIVSTISFSSSRSSPSSRLDSVSGSPSTPSGNNIPATSVLPESPQDNQVGCRGPKPPDLASPHARHPPMVLPPPQIDVDDILTTKGGGVDELRAPSSSVIKMTPLPDPTMTPEMKRNDVMNYVASLATPLSTDVGKQKKAGGVGAAGKTGKTRGRPRKTPPPQKQHPQPPTSKQPPLKQRRHNNHLLLQQSSQNHLLFSASSFDHLLRPHPDPQTPPPEPSVPQLFVVGGIPVGASVGTRSSEASIPPPESPPSVVSSSASLSSLSSLTPFDFAPSSPLSLIQQQQQQNQRYSQKSACSLFARDSLGSSFVVDESSPLSPAASGSSISSSASSSSVSLAHSASPSCSSSTAASTGDCNGSNAANGRNGNISNGSIFSNGSILANGSNTSNGSNVSSGSSASNGSNAYIIQSKTSNGRKSTVKVEDGDDSNSVTCFCRKPFAGRPMVECDSCATWFHLSCVKLKKSTVPDIWNCVICQETKDKVEPI